MTPEAVQLAPGAAPFPRSGGWFLVPAVLQKMETLFGTSLRDVRVFVGPHVTAFGAQALTHGNNVHFAPGQYDPASPRGQALLTRQLTYVVQQRTGRARNPFGSGIAVVANAALESEAERMASRAASPAAAQCVYDKWKNSTNSLRGRRVPRRAKWLRERDQQIEDVKRYMNETVAPWATQARIAAIIAADREELRRDATISDAAAYLRPHLLRTGSNPQIAPGHVSFLAPTRSESSQHEDGDVIHRGELEIEIHQGVPCVRVYSALFAEAAPSRDGTVRHKDVHQSSVTGEISIHTGGDGSGTKPIMWVSGGQPLRQLKWFYKYPAERNNPGARPVIRSFLVPLEVWDEISREAVNEDMAPQHENSPFNVDKSYGANQFAVRGPSLELLRKFAVAGSLISYVGNPSHARKKLGGEIRSIEVLHRNLGAPMTKSPLPIWIDEQRGEFADKGHQAGMADTLMFYYGVWTGKEEFIPRKFLRTPKARRHQLLREFLAQQGHPLPVGYSLP